MRVEREGFRGKSNRIAFGDYVRDFYLPTKRAALRRNTMRVYESIIANYLMPKFKDVMIPKLSRPMVQKMIS